MGENLAFVPNDWQRGLVVVAHPDDMEYGGSAAIAKWTGEGKRIAYVLATRGEAGIDGISPGEAADLREREQRESAAIVGVEAVEFLDHRDGVIEYGLRLRRDIAAAIRRHRPELVVTLNHHDTWGGPHWNTPDHKAVGRATLDAAADAGNRWIFSDAGERWDDVRWVAVAGSPQPTHAVDVDGAQEKATAALAAHAAYIQALSDQDPQEYAREWVERALYWTADRFDGRPSVAFELFET